MDARLEGVLIEDENGCLRVNDDLVIWPYGSYLKDNVIYDTENNLIAVIGESVVLGGGGFSTEENGEEATKAISSQLPSTQCSTPYFIVQSIL